jgi:hypothetical protein
MEYSIRFIDKVKVKGKSKAVAVFEVFDGDEPQVKESKLATKTIFEEVLSLNPMDRVAQIYQSRCQSQAEKPRCECNVISSPVASFVYSGKMLS